MSKIKLEVGMRTVCAIQGNGVIDSFDYDDDLAINIRSDKGAILHYWKDGNFGLQYKPTLKLLNIPFTEGLEVECDIFGSGVVSSIYEGIKSVYVLFENGHEQVYTSDGRIFPKANITLFPKYEI
jgi:hypothetical protein